MKLATIELATIAKAGAIAIACAWCGTIPAQDNYPSKPIRMIVGLAPGGLADQTARLLGPGLSQALGQPIVIENRVGANGNIAARQVADSAPDGYTLMLALDATLAIGVALNASTPFDPVKDFAPITRVIETPMAVFAHPSLEANNLAELLELMRSASGSSKPYFYGSAGNGSSGHLLGEYLKQLAGLKMTHVSYKGAADAARDTLAGQIPLMISSVGTSLPYVKAGKLKAIAVASNKRLAGLPDSPTAAESGIPALKGFNVQAWAAIVAPAGTPEPIIRRIHDAAAKALSDADLVARFAGVSASVAVSSPQELGQQIATELERWRRVVREANLRSQ